MSRDLSGSIRQRPSGTWEVRIYAGRDPATGKPRTIYRSARTEAEALKFAKRLRNQIIAGEVEAGSARTLAAAVAEWEQSGFAAELSPNTRANYKTNLRLHVVPHLGPLTLERLESSPKIVHDFQQWLVAPAELDNRVDVEARTVRFVGGCDMPAATARKVRTALSSVLTACVVWGYVHENPVRKVPPPKAAKIRRRAVALADAAKILHWAEQHDPTLLAYLWVAADAGSRRGEICGAWWSDLDWDAGTLTLERVIVIGDRGVEVRHSTKTDEDRTVALSLSTLRQLAAHRRRTEEFLSHVAGEPRPAAGYIFSRDWGATPWRPDYHVTRRLREIKDALGLDPSITLHGLRHTMVTQMLRLGFDIATVAGRAGHGASMALGTYNHRDMTADRQAAEAYAALLEAEVDKLRSDVAAGALDHDAAGFGDDALL